MFPVIFKASVGFEPEPILIPVVLILTVDTVLPKIKFESGLRIVLEYTVLNLAVEEPIFLFASVGRILTDVLIPLAPILTLSADFDVKPCFDYD